MIGPTLERGGRRSRLVALSAIVVAAGLAGAVLALVLDGRKATRTTTVVETAATATTQPAVSGSFTSIAVNAASGVVSILATTTVEVGGSPFGPPTFQETVVSGSGFVLDKQGHLLTSQHIVSGATKIHVSFADGHKVHAKLVASDPLLDLAVLSVNVPAATLHPLPLGSADDLEIGDPVVAIGNPFGLDRSVSVGVVSALHRSMVAPNGFTVANAVQTDAPINHGNSGGPLLDADGRVVGVAAQIADSGVDANVGVGFAVALDQPTRRAIATLEESGTVRHAWLGVSLDDIDAILATSDRVQTGVGVLVTGIVAGGPAARAGLTGGSQIASVDGANYCVGGDVITGVAGREVTSAADLETVLSQHQPGDEVTLAVVHANGKKANLKLTLGTQPTTAPETTTGCQ
jgi:S1-C subfamily serine protease